MRSIGGYVWRRRGVTDNGFVSFLSEGSKPSLEEEYEEEEEEEEDEDCEDVLGSVGTSPRNDSNICCTRCRTCPATPVLALMAEVRSFEKCSCRARGGEERMRAAVSNASDASSISLDTNVHVSRSWSLSSSTPYVVTIDKDSAK